MDINGFSVFIMIVAAFFCGFVLGAEIEANEEKHRNGKK